MKNKLHKNDLFRLGAVCLFILFTCLSNYYANYLKNNLSSVSARYDTPVISPKEIKKALNQQKKNSAETIPDLTLYNRKKEESLFNLCNRETLTANVYEVWGDMSKVIPMTFISGNYVYLGDEVGCVLDSKTAYALFGTTDALGNKVVWNEKEYIVRGVVNANDNMMLIQKSEEEYLYANLEAIYWNQAEHYKADKEGQQLENLLLENGLAKPEAILDGTLTSWLFHTISHLPIWILGMELIIILFRLTWQIRKKRLLFMLYGLGTGVVFFLFLKVTNFSIHIPSQFIPTKWSDLDFYVNKYKEVKENAIMARNCRLMPRDNLQSLVKMKCMIFTVLNIILILLAKSKR